MVDLTFKSSEMKKCIGLLIAFSFAFVVVGCGGKKVIDDSPAQDTIKVETDTIAQKVDNAIKAIVDSVKAVKK